MVIRVFRNTLLANWALVADSQLGIEQDAQKHTEIFHFSTKATLPVLFWLSDHSISQLYV